jgi:hypothetical protein
LRRRTPKYRSGGFRHSPVPPVRPEGRQSPPCRGGHATGRSRCAADAKDARLRRRGGSPARPAGARAKWRGRARRLALAGSRLNDDSAAGYGLGDGRSGPDVLRGSHTASVPVARRGLPSRRSEPEIRTMSMRSFCPRAFLAFATLFASAVGRFGGGRRTTAGRPGVGGTRRTGRRT